MLNPLLKIFLVLVALCIQFSLAFEQSCPEVNVSSDLNRGIDDIVRQGQVNERWTKESSDPIFTQHSLQMDYFYLTVKSDELLNENNFQLIWDDEFFAQSTFVIESNQYIKEKTFQYSIAIFYKCRQYGGTLLQYQFQIKIPECGQTSIHWNKPCGDPITPRNGLFVDIPFKNYNQTIVKDGLIVNASYFDEDIDNYVFRVPEQFSQTDFYIYMSIEEQEQQIIYEDQLQNDPQNQYNDIQTYLMMSPEQKIDQILVEADIMILNPIAKGEIAKGGQITEIPQQMTLEFNCQQSASALVQLTIVLHYFKDVNLFFIQECPGNLFNTLQQKEMEMGLPQFILVCTVIFCVISSMFNQCVRKVNGIDIIPFMRTIVTFLVSLELFNNTNIGYTMSQWVEKSILSPDPFPDISFSEENGMTNQSFDGEYIESNNFKQYTYGSL